MNTRVIAIAEMYVSENVDDMLITYSLGSCLGVTAYDPVARVGGMIHCLLPSSRSNPEKAKEKPTMYADTGLVALFSKLFEYGAHKDRIKIKVAGAGAPMDMGEQFRIGERNFAVLRKFLWKNNMLIEAQDIGGKKPRTMTLDMATGQTCVRTKGTETVL
ncbi:MAG: chemotaxis protein CheD [Phycisphaeraceae bacterium]|nr:chemotaxis protein CheD [Phycisphaeraceae bacterium]